VRRRNQQPAGQQTFRASCTAAELPGKLVYIAGELPDGTPVVSLAHCYDMAKVPAVGMVTAKPSDTEAVVQTSGLVRDLFSGLEVGKTYKLGVDGSIRRIAPTAPGIGFAVIQFVGVAVSESVLLLQPQPQLGVRRV